MHTAHSERRQSLQGPPPVVDDYKKLSWILHVGGAAPPIYVGLSEKWAKFQALNTSMRNFIDKRRMTADHSSARHCNEEITWHSANSQSRHTYFSSTRHCTVYKRQAGFRWGKVLLSRRRTFTFYAVEISKDVFWKLMSFIRAESVAVALSLDDQHTRIQPRDSRVLSASCIGRCCCMNSRYALNEKHFKLCSRALIREWDIAITEVFSPEGTSFDNVSVKVSNLICKIASLCTWAELDSTTASVN